MQKRLQNYMAPWGLLLAFVVTVVLSGFNPERIGDRVQIALPLAGLVCAASQGQGPTYVGRYLLLETGIKGSKWGLGDVPINRRPNGSLQGFPSGHTAAASFGAVALARSCLAQSPTAQAMAILAAGFTGVSRVEAHKHNIWQVFAGAAWGWWVQVATLRWLSLGFTALTTRISRLSKSMSRKKAGQLPDLSG